MLPDTSGAIYNPATMASKPEVTEASNPQPEVLTDSKGDDMDDVPDPDEDDLDDLDGMCQHLFQLFKTHNATLLTFRDIDMLEDFKDVKIDKASETEAQTSKAVPPLTDSATVHTAPKIDEDVLPDDDFAKQLQAGMAELMGEIENSVRPHNVSFVSFFEIDMTTARDGGPV